MANDTVESTNVRRAEDLSHREIAQAIRSGEPLSVDHDVDIRHEDNNVDPHAGPMKVQGESIFRTEYEGLMRSLPMYGDSYKLSMDPQYDPDIDTVHSYGESRESPELIPHVMMAGNQVWINKLAEGTNMREVNFAREWAHHHGTPFPYELWKTIVNDFGGRIPLKVRALPEGILIPSRNVMVTAENIGGRKTRALTTWLETGGLSHLWYMSTVATNDYYMKKLIGKYYDLSVDLGQEDPGMPYRDNDFGWRGVGPGVGVYGGGAHLFNSMGTDTFGSLPFMALHYMAKPGEIGHSIPAMEHSTVTSWGRDREYAAFNNMTDLYAGEGKLYAMVIDSYSARNAVEYISDPNGYIVGVLKARKGLAVLRPDSGNPVELLPQLASIVARNVGYTMNKKGYKVLNYFRFIWGDGITLETVTRILNIMVNVYGFSAENFAFGQGGAKLQVVSRDDLGFAYKCSAVTLWDGTVRNVYKQPEGIVNKSSKQGLVETFTQGHPDDWCPDDRLYVRDVRDVEEIDRLHLRPLMHDVFNTGKVLKRWSLPEVRENTNHVYYNATQGHSSGVYADLV